MSRRLRVDPIACTGHGLCAEHIPERIALDDWGYPLVADAAVTDELLAHARRAVAACPALALSLERDRTSGGGRA
ncbi:MAG TPA: ferredoxin [Conexibacter sp.]|jgi:ferredoxin|nr:ferredoxin [Conexibacter sp.]